MTLQCGHRVTIQAVLSGGVTHHIKVAVLILQHHSLRRCQCISLQLVHNFIRNLTRLLKFHRVAGLLRTQRAAGGRHANALDTHLQALLNPVNHSADNIGHLFNIFNLAIQHRTLAVLLFLNSQHMKAAFLGPANSANNAAGANIQRANYVFFLLLIFFRQSRHLFHQNAVLCQRRLRQTQASRHAASGHILSPPHQYLLL